MTSREDVNIYKRPSPSAVLPVLGSTVAVVMRLTAVVLLLAFVCKLNMLYSLPEMTCGDVCTNLTGLSSVIVW